jgi:hypothetical protein
MTSHYAWFPSRRELESTERGVERFAIGESWKFEPYRASRGKRTQEKWKKLAQGMLRASAEDRERFAQVERKKGAVWTEDDMPLERGLYLRVSMHRDHHGRLFVVGFCRGPSCGGKRKSFPAAAWMRPEAGCNKCGLNAAAAARKKVA